MKKMMNLTSTCKKGAALVLAGIMAFSLSGCGQSANAQGDSQTQQERKAVSDCQDLEGVEIS